MIVSETAPISIPAAGERCVVILAPFGQDAGLLTRMLSSEDITAQPVSDLETFARLLPECAVGLLTTEALHPNTLTQLQAALAAQPPWSDIPLILLTGAIDAASYALLAGALGNVTIIQRPLEAASLLTVVRTALRARQKQYQVRDLIAAGEKQQARILALNQHLMLAIDTARMGTLQMDWKTGKLDCSPQCKANFGLAPDASLSYGQLVAMVVPEDRERMQKAVRQAIDTHSLYEIEYRVHWPDGSLQWIVASGRALYDAEGAPDTMVGITLRVTDRKRSEIALRESKESLDLAINGAQLGTFYCDMPFDKIIWNDTCKDHFFLPHEASVDFDLFYSRLHPDDREPTRQAIARCMDDHVQYNVEYRVVAPDGRMRWINAIGKGYYTETGEPYRFDGITIDITEKKTRERALRLLVEINDATRALQEPAAIMATVARLLGEHLGVSRCAYASVEEDGNHFTVYEDYANGCASIAGRYALKDFGPRTFTTLQQGQTYVIHDREREVTPEDDLAPIAAMQIEALIGVPLLKEGKLRALMSVHQNQPRRWTAEEVQLVEMVGERSWAIIERAQADQRLQERAEEIATLNARLRRAMRETHHRVKNNLQVISAMIEMQVLEHQDQNVVPIEEFTRLKTHVHTLSFVHDLLTTSLNEDEGPQRISTRAVLEKLLSMLQRTAWKQTLRYTMDEVELSSRQCIALAFVLNELVSNALKHGRGQANVAFTVEDRSATLIVQDDGPGFLADFDPKLAANTGLELVGSLTRTDLQGTVCYGSQPQGGGQVTVTFPLPEDAVVPTDEHRD